MSSSRAPRASDVATRPQVYSRLEAFFEMPLSCNGRTVWESAVASADFPAVRFLREVVFAPFPPRQGRLGVFSWLQLSQHRSNDYFSAVCGLEGAHVLFAVTDAESNYSVPWPPPLVWWGGIPNLHAGNELNLSELIIGFR